MHVMSVRQLLHGLVRVRNRIESDSKTFPSEIHDKL